ncbi:hypothetical protein IWW34DRAFT_820242 [Fusarium oxysporum f. sp. albedinis]|nr:hypothetical protein IWW34DRAFT_820242 [Fusarium oxysporum f. sp. albedinis]
MRTRSGTETHEDNATSARSQLTTKQAKTSNARPFTPDGPKPVLTEKELEFDFDHSQIRDPRAPPGRGRRPRYEERELSEEFLSKVHILKHRNKHTDPLYSFYDLHRCHRKGPDGSPTYDSAGFQLDYEKVAKWMKPVAYDKSPWSMAWSAISRESKRRQKKSTTSSLSMGRVRRLKRAVSKDLGVPWHQIDPKQLKKWEDQGFAEVDADKWWHRPNQVERDRFMKMLKYYTR